MRHPHFRSVIRILASSMSIAIYCCGVAIAQSAPLPQYLTQRDGKTDPQSISSDEALWAVFEVISTVEDGTPGSGVKVLQAGGLSQPDALALFEHIRTSVDDVKAYANEVRRLRCADTTPLTSSSAVLARSLQAIDSSMEGRRAARVAEIDHILSPAGKVALISWVNAQIRPHLTIVSVDHVKRLSTAAADLGAEIALLCTKSAPTNVFTGGSPPPGSMLPKNTAIIAR